MRERFEIDPEAVANRMGDQIVVVHVGTDRIFELNSTAARIWDLLVEGRDRDEIPRVLSREFNISEEVAAQETRDLLNSLIHEKIVRVLNEGQPNR